MRENGQLEVQYANDNEARDYINLKIERIESEVYKKVQKEKQKQPSKRIGSAGANAKNVGEKCFLCIIQAFMVSLIKIQS
ncbi:hypothetical protein SAMN05421839_1406 [Halolactibacillus halophilus]|uniref:Uncharacterized protein n=1 Tax=Halolactibacillus halophilus TaxID=306540 RepID=A0A1I5S7W5_9BACI|nr:hypothetical protein [Halolactibacillus halophilus]GEM02994.1 hypothetical protein HHA03_25260 [Halolactibacillus halophilus]SFP66814.1 hypothetical protein SAMN05421839_1406 [Halolactibacillus halophilus]